MGSYKVCPKCSISKDFTLFYKNKKTKDGLKSWCKACCNEDSRSRESKYNETRRNYRVHNKELCSSIKRSYYKDNKSRILSSNSEWRKSTFSGRINSYKRSASKRNIEWSLSDSDFKSFWGVPCYYCGDSITTIGLDRVDSSRGYFVGNLVSCCTECNVMKNKLNQSEFLNKIKRIYELHGN